MILELVEKNHSALVNATQAFDFANPPVDPQELFENLRDTMVANRGVGLAANQVGLPYSVFVVGHPDDPESVFSVFNPKIVDSSEGEVLAEEGCLTFPGLFVKIKRPSVIRVRYTTHTGVTDTIKFEGMTARIFQHEYDHLNGTRHVDRASRFHLEQAERQKKKLDRLRKKNLK
jgi:peptide deformylase